ncbi:hypothetical protein [Riemerella anatipestifer]|uniref:hypothetical protein n=1 Tax=Riemerella anatipestifer TaxID=34085 RepID=UPI00129E6502|nr:hypothetical protein [Riemerella anatipestifer]MRM82503.1 hypothetical protein [Riemerella anatipestifer]
MKKILLCAVFLPLALQAQVGINTPAPKATLDVVGKASSSDSFDGIIAPRLKGVELKAKTYTSEQKGAIVYVTGVETSPTGQTANVTDVGYYYFDGSSWQKLSGKTYTESETIKLSGTSFQRAALTGDVTADLNSNDTKVTKIQGSSVSATAPQLGQLLVWDGTAWTPTGGLRRADATGGIVDNTVTLRTTDNGGYVYVDSTSPTTVEVPDSLPLGFSCVIVQNNVGQITVSNSSGARGSKTRTQYSAVGIIKDTWTTVTVTGDSVN